MKIFPQKNMKRPKKEICREYGTDDDNYLVNGAVLVCDRATSDLVLVKGQPIIPHQILGRI